LVFISTPEISLKYAIEQFKLSVEVSPFSIFCILAYGCIIDLVDSKKLVINFTIFTGSVYLIVAFYVFFKVSATEAGNYGFLQIVELA